MALGPLMVGVAGTALAPEERERLRHPLVGGVILFGRNYAEPAQLQALVEEIHALREPRLLVAVDQEGGRVQRFRAGFTELPPVRGLGTIYDRDAGAGRRLALDTGWLMAAELRAAGVDISLAPVLDLDRGVSEVIGDRGLHRDPEAVASLAYAYVAGMRRAGMEATGKHFPGHGAVHADSHRELPVDDRPLARIQDTDMAPFLRLIHEGIAALIVAHVAYPALDERPAGYSPRWVRELLRERLRFQGVIFSDDLGMAAAGMVGDYPERAQAALEAGCDVLLICNDLDVIPKVLDQLRHPPDPVAQARLVRLHGRRGLSRERLRASPRWRAAVEAVKGYASPHTMDLDI
ncbi:MAG: beta-N-acetylhexosaminidase [Gammaproteobacteria bacterium]|nr:beta-N-acetylhexosaminidase [Gammaproteobacteria bacterium]